MTSDDRRRSIPRWPTRRWRGFVDTLKTPRVTTNGAIAMAGLVGIAAAGLTFSGFQYSDWRSCAGQAKIRVESRDALRDVLFDFAHGVEDALPGSEGAHRFAVARVDYINGHYPAISLTDALAVCGSEPWLSRLLT